MTRVDSETVRVHRVVNLTDNRGPRRLDTENLLDLHDVVGRRQVADDTCVSSEDEQEKGEKEKGRNEPSVVMTSRRP